MNGDESEKQQALNDVRALLREERWAALAVLDRDGLPAISQVAFACSERFDALYLLLSNLAAHSRALARQPACALAIGRPDPGSGDPQQLPRLTLQGEARIVAPSDTDYSYARAVYLARLPDAAPRFEFADFALYRLIPQRLRYVGGFGRAFSYRPEQLQIPDNSQ